MDMVAAINAVKTNQITISGAANHFHVPRKTLVIGLRVMRNMALSLEEIQFFQ